MEAAVIGRSDRPATAATLTADLRALGAWDASDVDRLGAAYRAAGGEVVTGPVGRATAELVPVGPLVDFGVGWPREHRR